MSKDDEFERRLAAVEQAFADLQRRLANVADPNNWLDKVIGSISDVEAFEEALKYGREFRYSDRPADEDDENP
ncbi:MAG: transferase hexapeptide repeat containing protein [Fimbriimonadales bacterium]